MAASRDERCGRWVITGKAFSLGSMMAAGDDLRDVALPELSRLQVDTGETFIWRCPTAKNWC